MHNPMFEARDSAARDADESFRALVADEQDLDTKEFNLIEHVGNEGDSGLWDAETRAMLDLTTLKGLFFGEDWVYILVDRFASKIAAQPLRVMRWTVTGGKGRGEPAEGHPVQRTLERPNQFQDYHAFMYSLVADLIIAGNAIVWNARISNRLVPVPVEMVRCDFDRNGLLEGYSVFQFGREDTPLIMQRSMKFRTDEIVHVRRPNPSSMLWGLSPFIPGRKSMLFNRYSTEYLNNFYIKGAQPGLALELGEGANEKSALRLLRSLEIAHTGRRNQRRNMILPRGVSAKEITQKLADQDLIEYIKSNRETFMNLLQVPKQELSLQEAGSLGSEEYRIALRNFWGGPLRATMRMVAGALTDAFIVELGKDYYLEFDLSDVDALRDDEEQKGKIAEGMLKTHTLNEVRAKVYDAPPLPDGDKTPGPTMPVFGGAPTAPAPQGASTTAPQTKDAPAATTEPAAKAILTAQQFSAVVDLAGKVGDKKMPRAAALAMLRVGFGLSEMDAEAVLAQVGVEAAAPPPSTEPPAPETKDVRGRNMDRLAPIIKSGGDWWKEREATLEKGIAGGTERMQKRAAALLSAQGAAIAKAVRSHLASKSTTVALRLKAKGVPSKAVLERRIRAALKEMEATYVADATADLEATMELAYNAQMTLPFDLPNKDAIAAAHARDANKRRSILEERALDTFANVSKTTTERAMYAVESGLRSQSTIDDIATSITASTDGALGEQRAQVIARTEALTAASVGQAAAMQNAAEVVPKLKKAWLNAGDERVRGNPDGLYSDSKADHWTLQGEVRAWDAAFSNGLQFPREPGGPADETIQCRCTWVMVPGADADQIGLEDLDSEAWGGTER